MKFFALVALTVFATASSSTISCYTATTTASSDPSSWSSAGADTACAAGIVACQLKKVATTTTKVYSLGCGDTAGTPASVFYAGCKAAGHPTTAEDTSWKAYTTNPGTKTVAEVKAVMDPLTAACSAAGRTIPSLVMVAMAFLVTKFNC